MNDEASTHYNAIIDQMTLGKNKQTNKQTSIAMLDGLKKERFYPNSWIIFFLVMKYLNLYTECYK